MKALVKESASPGFKLKDVAEPRIREDEVLIRVRRAGVCGTDVHIYDWDAWAKGRCKPPFIVGHEFAGDNLVLVKKEQYITRACRECLRIATRKHDAKRRPRCRQRTAD